VVRLTFSVKDGMFSYGRAGAQVLKGVNFQVEKGDVLAILGPNGAGKTTLLKCMMGILRWSGGGSYLDTTDVRKIPPRTLFRKIAYVAQAKGAPSALTVEEMVLLGRCAHISALRQPAEVDREKARCALSTLGISALSTRLCTQLSGGELQMALIARALSTEPEMLILDEPESNLDFRNQLIVLDAISKLAMRGIACVFNTHYPAHALRRANRALIIQKGGAAIFGDTGNVVTEENIARAFGVRAVIGEIETPHNIVRDVLPVSIVNLWAEGDRPDLDFREDESLESIETRIAIMGIIVEDRESAEGINRLLHQYGDFVIGRMGMPYPKKGVSLICVILDAPQDTISTLSGKLGMLNGVSIKTTYSKK